MRRRILNYYSPRSASASAADTAVRVVGAVAAFVPAIMIAAYLFGSHELFSAGGTASTLALLLSLVGVILSRGTATTIWKFSSLTNGLAFAYFVWLIAND